MYLASARLLVRDTNWLLDYCFLGSWSDILLYYFIICFFFLIILSFILLVSRILFPSIIRSIVIFFVFILNRLFWRLV